MPDVSDITSTAVQLARRKGKSPAGPMKSPKKMAAAGAGLMALPFAAEGLAKLVGGSPADKAADLGKKAKGKAAEGAKEVVGDVADEKLGSKLPGGLGGLFHKNGSDSDSDSEEATEAHGSGRRMPIQ